MKKNGFLEGAMISTISVIVCKIIGLIYVIPFYAIIGTQGGALYSYAYSIYGIFLSLATSGIPIAISKIISEYSTLEYQNTKERAYRIGSILIIGLGLISFIILFVFAPQIAHAIMGNVTGGNTVENITLVIRVISTALLFVPVLSVNRGYLQGLKYMVVPNISYVLEQLVRVAVIIGGSFIALKVFDLPLHIAVSIAVFGATIGAFVTYIYMKLKVKKYEPNLLRHALPTREEAKITNKDIFKKLIFYAMPFIVIDLFRSAFNMVDIFTVVKTLVALGYSVADAENIIGIMTTWASKLNMIVTSIVIGLTSSLIPNIMSSFIKKDKKDVSRKINQSLQILLMSTIPMTIGLCFLATPIWIIFFGYDPLGIDIFRVYIFTALSMSFYSILIDTTQTLNNTKIAIGTLVGTFIMKCLLNVPMMYMLNYLGIDAYYGPIVATFLSQLIAICFLLYEMHKYYQVTYKESLNTLLKTILCTSVMVVSLLILKIFIPLNVTGRMMSLCISGLYAVVGVIIYAFVAYKSKLLEDTLGCVFLNRVLKIFKFKDKNK